MHPGLEAFMAVVKQSTVHGAARAIGLTQTGVTQRIRVLERQLGFSLFTRSRKGMRPTSEGEALLRYCQGMRDLEGEFLAAVGPENAGEGLRVHITGPSSVMRARVIPGAMRALAAHPGLTFTFNLEDESSGLESLKTGLSQLAVLESHEVVDELDSKRLKPARYILVGAAAWKGRPVREVVATERIIDFDRSDQATFQYLRRHRLISRAKRERHLANDTDALASLVAGGYGYSVLSTEFAAPLLRRGELVELNPGKALEVGFSLAWYPRHAMPAYFAALVDSIT